MSTLSAHARGRVAGEGGQPLGANPFAAPAVQMDWLQGYVKTSSPANRRLAERRISKLRAAIRSRQDFALREPRPGGNSLP